MADIEIKNLTKLFIILLFSEGEQHGYDIMKTVKEELGRKASPGQVYPFLKQLEKHHYIISNGRSVRERQVYHLTPEGKRFISRVSSKLGEIFDIAIKQRISKCANCECEVYKGSYSETINGKRFSFCCANCAKNFKANKSKKHNNK